VGSTDETATFLTLALDGDRRGAYRLATNVFEKHDVRYTAPAAKLLVGGRASQGGRLVESLNVDAIATGGSEAVEVPRAWK
jgi:hypothetical protein